MHLEIPEGGKVEDGVQVLAVGDSVENLGYYLAMHWIKNPSSLFFWFSVVFLGSHSYPYSIHLS
jgi:hypothetical protein